MPLLTFIAENQTAGPIALDDLGVTVPPSGSYTLSDGTDASGFHVYEIRESNDLEAAIQADDILLNDGSGTLSKAESLAYLTPIDGLGFTDHSANHENGGIDEISVAGLSGLLADAQTPLTHSITAGHNGFPGNTTTFLRGDGTFATPAGSGDVVGPVSSTDNALARFDGITGKLIQNSVISLSDTGNLNTSLTSLDVQVGGSSALTIDDSTATSLSLAEDGYLVTWNAATSSLEYRSSDYIVPQPITNASLTSGVVHGGQLSINGGDNTKFDIATGKGFILDYWTDQQNPTIIEVDLGGTAITVTNLATDPATYVLVDSSGTVIQQITPPTAVQRRENIFLGQLGHAFNVAVVTAFSSPVYAQSVNQNLHDLGDSLGNINAGIGVSPNGANLQINRSAGVLFGLGSNYANDIQNPNNVSISAQSPLSFRLRTQTGNGATNVTLLDVANYDVGGTITPVVGNRFQNFRVYQIPTGNTVIQYGQNTYASMSASIDEIPNESFVLLSNLAGFATLIGIITVRSNATNLSDDSQARFFAVSKFGETSSITAAGTGLVDHGLLIGLTDDDHTQYLLVNGTRAMTGAIDMGTNNITNVGTVDGVDVSDHSARHENGGADEISVAGLSGLLADAQTPLAHSITAGHNDFPGGTTTFLRGDGTFATPGGSGDVVGPISSTDNALARFDGITGKLIQNSTATLSDTGDLTIGLVNGVDIADHSVRHETGGADPIDGYQVDLVYSPLNYNAPVNDIIGEHIAAIDEALGVSLFGNHASTHENGGADEISVAGLSGLLADAQTPLTHSITAGHNGFPGGTDVFLRGDGVFAEIASQIIAVQLTRGAAEGVASFSTASVSASAGSLLVLDMLIAPSSAPVAFLPTVVGLGGTWVRKDDVGELFFTCQRWCCEITADSTDTVDVSWSGTNADIAWSLMEITGHKPGMNGGNALLQTVRTSSNSVTLAPFDDSVNRCLASWGANYTPDPDGVPDSTMVQVGTTASYSNFEWVSAIGVEEGDNEYSITWAGSYIEHAIASEIAAARVNVIGPLSSTDSGVVRFDGTSGKIIKDSSVIISDAGLINGVNIADHSARHENGGADEISVAGLSGLLADPQTPLTHSILSHNGFPGGTTTFLRSDGAFAAPIDIILANQLTRGAAEGVALFSTASVSASAGSLLVLDMLIIPATTPIAFSPTVVGLGGTWVREDPVFGEFATSQRWRCEISAGSTDTVDVSWSGTNADIAWSLMEITGHKPGLNGDNAFAQTSRVSSDSVTLSPFANQASRCLASWGANFAPDPNGVPVPTMVQVGTTASFSIFEWVSGIGPEELDNIYSITWAGSYVALAIASEIIASRPDVIGPDVSTDNAVALFDGTTGKFIKNSSVTVSTDSDITTPGNFIQVASVDYAELPTNPSTGNSKLYSKTIANRPFISLSGPNSDYDAQPFFGRSSISWLKPVGNSTTVHQVGILTSATGTETAANVATTNLHTQMKRLDYLDTTPSTTAVAGVRDTAAQYFRGASSLEGGFTLVCRWGPATGVATSTNRAFVGLTNSTSAPTDVEPSTLIDMLGMGWDSSDGYIQVMHNDGSGTATKVSTGIDVPTADRESVYEIVIHCDSGSSDIYFEVTDLVDNITFGTSTSSNIPSTTTLMALNAWMSVGGTSSVIGLSIMSIYLECPR